MYQVLVEAEQIRREKDDVGPMAELEYWRKWLTKFTSVVEFIKTEKLKMCLQCLRLSRSKIIPVRNWIFFLGQLCKSMR